MADTLIFQEISITKLQKGWVKLEGANRGYNTPQENKEWNCQACGLVQPPQITAYLFPFDNSEILRVCPLCQNTVVENQIKDFIHLVELVR